MLQKFKDFKKKNYNNYIPIYTMLYNKIAVKKGHIRVRISEACFLPHLRPGEPDRGGTHH